MHRFRLGSYLFLVLFWIVSLWNLNRFPVIHQDEPWILSPGYKLFAQALYGSDFFSGFYGMQQHYLQFMPLMPVLEGAVTRAAGVGILQMRFVTVALGLLILALAYRLGNEWGSPRLGMLSVVLLVTWQWTNGGGRALGTGIPLVDLARIARYDILAATLGLAALVAYLAACHSHADHFCLFAGVLGGLAALAHLYGLFWIAALLALIWLGEKRIRARRLLMLVGGAFLTWLPWLSMVASNWNDYLGQIYADRRRYDLLNVRFYVSNLLNEPRRYALDLVSIATFERAGFLLLFAGLPIVWLWLAASSLRRKDQRGVRLAALSLLIPSLFAIFTSQKLFNYLLTVVPLWATVMAWGFDRMLSAPTRVIRLAGIAILILTGLQGFGSILQMQQRAAQMEPAESFLVELRAAIPSSARVLGHPQYALAFDLADYRSFLLLFLLSDPDANPKPLSMEAALKQVAPRYILYDRAIDLVFSDRSRPLNSVWNEQFLKFMRDHHAYVIRTIRDQDGNSLSVYQLEW